MKHLLLSLSIAMFFCTSLMAQKDTVVVTGYYELLQAGNADEARGTLNRAIEDVKANGDINNTVFKLKPYEVYVLTSSIFMDVGEDLEIVGPEPLRAGEGTDEEIQNSAPPQLVWTEEEIDRVYIIQTFGDLKMENVWVRGADIQGNQVQTGIVFEDTVATGQEPDKEYGRFDGVIFDYFPIGAESGGAVTVKADNFVGIFKNSYFRNLTDSHFQYYGRAVSFPYQSTGFHYDSLLFENTTFANLSRIVMMEGNQNASNIHLNHVTMINSLEWAIQTGWWEDLSITNSIFVNTNMIGQRPVDVCPEGTDADIDDFYDGLCNPLGGGVVQDPVLVDSLGFEVDFTDQDRQIYIGNNVFYIEDYLEDWYMNSPWSQEQIQSRDDILLRFPSPPIGQEAYEYVDSTDSEGNDVFPRMTIDSTTFYDDPADFIVPATNQDTMLTFVMYKWDDNSDVDWSYRPAAGYNQTWPLPENMAYNNTEYQTAAWGGYPMGDLNWYPDQLADWEANQREADWAQIEEYMNEGVVVSSEREAGTPKGFALEQNYPNPFNPTTNISYSIPEASDVSLTIYNAMGQEVATLYQGMQSAGNHTVTFNASNLASGIYFYRLDSPDAGVSITRKLTLIK
ncbi:T9SS type A sorting domain-containing protein [Gracilimonas mengyeensis]|uniref:Por secretion system C-terminal sorting domain-containing protein n=1 Tax=Gracilimonas mengyeensis TaxID=1302730 RepID=A0A521B642_9BACT|nr:T9SS type A sorting domain-containing protein [Gracilimonas mengyeensis]SMO42578.1 Por secretion system C-terminal sorting domain-containing protein [Gracilimonas mengyeensis]